MEDKNQEFIDAVKNNDVNQVKVLLNDERVDPSADDNYAIRYAAENGRSEVVRLLLQDGRVDPSADDNYAIRNAARNSNTEVVRLLLQDGRADPSAENNNVIIWAAGSGREGVVKMLLQDGRADPTSNNNYAIRFAAFNSHPETVKVLLQDPRVDPSSNNNFIIKWASRSGHTEIVELLLQDPRVDWRVIKDNPIVRNLLKQQNDQMKTQYIASYLSLENKTTRTLDLGKKDEGQQTLTKSVLKPVMLQQLSYRGFYEELCSNIPPNIKIPPMKLIALANALKIEYDFNNINWTELCAKVKASLHLVIFH